MTWPTGPDYNEALQSPQTSFSDPELKLGRVETDKLGLPRPISGRYAVVYRMDCNGRSWAVRCFLSEVPDQQQRYAAISDHLKQSRLTYTVGFEYFPQGILIHGKWYPILKMEWITGQPLNAYVEQHLHHPTELMRLAASWMDMTKALRNASLAHGDLQDGNVLVAGNALKLIDYDGMFVPKLAGRISREIGHHNYQHPNRTGTDYGLYLDNFSDWVIYISLVALAIDPSLWTRLKGGDDCILFRKGDFVPKNGSGALALLAQHSDARLQSLASIFESLLYLLPSQIPDLTTNSLVSPELGALAPLTPAINGASWIDDHLRLPPAATGAHVAPNVETSASAKPPPMPTASPTWILDFITPIAERKTFSNSVSRLRIILVLMLLTMTILPLLFSGNGVGLLGDTFLASVFCCLPFLFYRRDPVVEERLKALEGVQEKQSILSNYEASIQGNEMRKQYLRLEETKARGNLDNQYKPMMKTEERKKNVATAELKAKIDTINQRVSNLNRPLHKLQTDNQAGLARTNQLIAQLNQAQSSEIASVLQPLQHQFVQDCLRSATISTARIPGIGPAMSAQLAYNGYVSAADVNWRVQNVHGIGNSKASALMGWRNFVENSAKQRMPMNLSKTEVDAITLKYEAQRQQHCHQAEAAKVQFESHEQALKQQIASDLLLLDRERTVAQQFYQQQMQSIISQYQSVHNQFDKQGANVKAEYNKKCGDLDQDTLDVRKKIYDQNWQLAKARQELDAYKFVTFACYLRYLFLNQS